MNNEITKQTITDMNNEITKQRLLNSFVKAKRRILRF